MVLRYLKKLAFYIKRLYVKKMQKIKRFVLVFFLLFCLTGCSGILLNPSRSVDGHFLYVRQGDTLYSLAKKNNISMRDLIEENNLKEPYRLYSGQKLRIPQAQMHIVQKGDTLYSISRKYGMSVSALSRLNKLKEPYTISVGQKLAVNQLKKNVVPTNKHIKKHTSSATSQNKKTKVTSKKQTVIAKKEITVPKKQTKQRFVCPVKGKIVSDFGAKQKTMQNDGINIAAKKGTSVVAAEAGTIGYAGNQLKGYGNLILIRHANGWMTAYAHNDKVFVKKDQKVKKGQKIATVGKTGNVTTPQLHFEIRYKTKVVNPKKYLQ